MVVAEFMRIAMGAHRHEIISCHLRNLEGRTVIGGAAWPPYNPGAVQIKAAA